MPDNIPDIVFKIDSNDDNKESTDEKIDFMIRIEESLAELADYKDSIDRNALMLSQLRQQLFLKVMFLVRLLRPCRNCMRSSL